ncbi:MAG: hypothetical protein SV201_14665 [Pseudomonadota bacterium]|nr:hypothetical protein [Pseudomonadota bacterium]
MQLGDFGLGRPGVVHRQHQVHRPGDHRVNFTGSLLQRLGFVERDRLRVGFLDAGQQGIEKLIGLQIGGELIQDEPVHGITRHKAAFGIVPGLHSVILF